jgi:hypothetical protein
VNVPVIIVGVAPLALVRADVDEVLAGYEVEAFEAQRKTAFAGDLLHRQAVVDGVRVVAADAVEGARDREADDGRHHRSVGCRPHDERHLERAAAGHLRDRPPQPVAQLDVLDRGLLASEAVAPQLELARRPVRCGRTGARLGVHRVAVLRHDRLGLTDRAYRASLEPHHPAALPGDLVEAVRREQDTGAVGAALADVIEALLAESHVADGHHLVQQQRVRSELSQHAEREP